MKQPSLRELQEWMRWLITDPRGVAPALREPHPPGRGPRYQAPGPDLSGLIRARSEDEREQRLSVYAEGYFSRLVDALAADYPSVARVLGEEGFQTLVHEYLKVHPSGYFSINEAGRHLPEFIAANGPSAGELAGLADLARLEWLMIESFYAPATRDFAPERLQVQDADWAGARIELAGGTRFFDSHHAIERVRLEGLTGIPAENTPRFLMIRRQADGFPTVERLEQAESLCLRALQAGDSLGVALEKVAILAPATENGAVAAWFQRWTALGLISDVVFPPQPD